MPFTALKQEAYKVRKCASRVVRRLMLFTALKLILNSERLVLEIVNVVRRLMLFTALKPPAEI